MADIVVDKLRSIISLELETKKAVGTLKSIQKFDKAFTHSLHSARLFNKALAEMAGHLDRIKGLSDSAARAQEAFGRKSSKSARKLGKASVGLGLGSSDTFDMGESKAGRKTKSRGMGIAAGVGSAVGGAVVGGVLMAGKGLVSATKSAIEFESKMAEVRKVVSGLDDPKQFDAMGKSIRDLSERIPIASEGIADIVAAAGQAGIAKDDLLVFAESAAKVGVAFDITAEQAGDSLAKVQTSMGLSMKDTNSLMGTINELSNSMAASAPEILKVVTGVGALGQQAGLAGEKTAALGSAMVAAGANASNATTATKNLFLALGQGATAPEKTQKAFKALGLTSEKVAKQMQVDAEGTIKDVFARIQQLKPEERTPIITQIFGKLSAGTIGPLISNLDLLDKAFATANDKMAAGASIQKEFESKSNTTANAIQLLKNRFENFKVEVGNKVLPLLKRLFKAFDNPAVKKFVDEAMNGVIKAVEFLISNMPSAEGMFENLVGTLKGAWSVFESLWKIAKPLFEILFETSVAVGKEVINIFKELGGVIDELGSIFSLFFSDAEGNTNSFGRVIIDVFKFGIVGAFKVVKDMIVDVKNQFRLFREMIESFSAGNIGKGLAKIGEMLLNVVLAPLRMIVRELIRLTDAIPGMEGFAPKSVREFAFGKGAPETKTYGEIAKETIDKQIPGGGIGSTINTAVGKFIKKGIDEAGFQTAASEFVGPTAPKKKITIVRGGKRIEIEEGEKEESTSHVPGGFRGSKPKKEKEELNAFEQLINSKIEKRVEAAEFRAGAMGLDVDAAGKAARKEATRLAQERKFAALGIDPATLLGPAAGMGIGGQDKPPISIVNYIIQAGAITGGIHISGSFAGSAQANASAIYRMIVDEVSQAAQLRATPQVA